MFMGGVFRDDLTESSSAMGEKTKALDLCGTVSSSQLFRTPLSPANRITPLWVPCCHLHFAHDQGNWLWAAELDLNSVAL